MGRKTLIKSDQVLYHVFARANNKDFFYIPALDCWRIYSSRLRKMSTDFGTEISAFVLMSNHFHMLIRTPRSNLDKAMRWLLTESAKRILVSARRINHLYGNRYRWSIIPNAYGAAYVYKYVLRNPVRAGLVTSVEKYRFSSINRVSLVRAEVPVVEFLGGYGELIPRNPDQRLRWLNESVPAEAEEMIKKGLRRFHFRFPLGNDYQKALRQLWTGYGIGCPDGHAPATF